MEKRPACLFYGLAVFVFLLYFTKVSSDSILDVMKNDTKLCDVPVFLYKNNITNICAKETYPSTSITVNPQYRNTLLCLAFYDTWYKVNKSSPLCDFLLKNSTDSHVFYSRIYNFFPKEENDDKIAFCKQLKDVKFSYNKLEPLLPVLQHVHSFSTCYTLCFDMNGEFNPLCAILAWSKSIDTNTDQQTIDQLKVKIENQLKSDSKEDQTPLSSQPKNSTKLDYITTTGEANNKSKVSIESPVPNLTQKLVTQDPVGDKKHDKVMEENHQKGNGMDVEVGIENPQPQDKSDKTTKKSKEIQDSIKELQNTDTKPITMNGESQNTHNESQIAPKEPQNNQALKNDTKKVQKPSQPYISTKSTDINKTGTITKINDKTTEPSDNEKKVPINEDQEEENHSSANLSGDPNYITETDPYTDRGDETQNMPKPFEQKHITSHYQGSRSSEESHFFTYFTVVSLISIVAYIGYYNKQKILAIVLEGRRSRNSRGRKRPSFPTANYRKLDCTLEEAVTSQCNANVTHVIY